MAISRIAGQMLNTNLQRDGVNLSFSNSGNSTPVLYLDVGNTRVGINNSAPGYNLDVTGNTNITNTLYSNVVSASSNVIAGNVLTNTVISTGTFTLNTTSNGNILLTPNGTGFAKAVGTNGFVVPTGNTAQRPSPVDTGTIRFNTTGSQLEVWDGSAWSAASGYISVITNQTEYGDGSTVTFSLTRSATAESILVTLNGVMQTPGVDYNTTSSPDTIVFTTAPSIADTIQIRFIVSTTTISSLINGTSSMTIPISSGNVLVGSGGVANVLVVTSTGANIAGYADVTGNVKAAYFIGDGSQLTNLSLNYGNSNVAAYLPTYSGNISGGNISVTGNIVSSNINISNISATSVSASGNVVGNNLYSNGIVSAVGNITAGNLSVSTGNVTLGNIINAGANGVGNIGSSTNYFNTVFAKATSAQYADLAEMYAADQVYEPGTVVIFGGDFEITLATEDADPCVAGVVSTNPSYIMNAGIFCEFPTQLALTGRVPCSVIGNVTAGAMMVSAGNGCARAEKSPAMGTVIGKAVESFIGDSGTIEIVVGRL
jgi:cytoskeletal protein CcmA (bactofilin family)